MKHVAIVGAGGIGRRHLQSCLTLPLGAYHLHIVEPSAEQSRLAAALLEPEAESARASFYPSVAQLPAGIDLAVVATNSDVRADVTRALIESKSVRRLILEKVLFERLDDYRRIGECLEKAGAKAWVNCPRRAWKGYQALHSEFAARTVCEISMATAQWDMGCNAIHFLDVFAYLIGSDRCRVDSVVLDEVKPAKRRGFLWLAGRIEGSFERESGEPVPYRIVSAPDGAAQWNVTIACGDGSRVSVTEQVERMTVIDGEAPDASTYPIPFQSALTASLVEEILSSDRSVLSTYAESRRLHEPMIAGFLQALSATGRLDEPGRCPVT